MRRLAVILLPLLLLAGCKKDGDTNPPDDGTSGDDGAAADTGEPEVEIVPQDPDPPELATARKAFVLGDMESVKSSMEPLMSSLSEPSQARANGIASALFALAVAEELAENAKDPAETALAKGEEVRDDEVLQLGHIAMGAHLVGVGDAASAQAELEKAASLGAANGDLANLYLAQSLLNQAFDESDKLTDPAKLDDAEKVYRATVEASDDAAIKGRGLTGLAAIAKYQRKKEQICEHAKAAAESYEAAGASDYLKEVPSILADAAKCK
jgi:hypothetical protein